jgi:hypothetical protein
VYPDVLLWEHKQSNEGVDEHTDIGKFDSMKDLKHVCAHEGMKAVTLFDKVYVPEEDDCAETGLVYGNVYNNTSMLEGKRTIFVNAVITPVSTFDRYSRGASKEYEY